MGSRTVQLRHIGRGHTDNDVFLFMPEENVLHTGDLLFNGSHGFMDQNGGVLSQGWQRSVQAMLALTNSETVVIPGHGEITNRAGLQRQYDYFEQLRDAVTRAVAQGLTKEQVMELRPTTLSDVTGNPSRNLGVVYDEVRGAEDERLKAMTSKCGLGHQENGWSSRTKGPERDAPLRASERRAPGLRRGLLDPATSA